MNRPPHTPGPWSIITREDGTGADIAGPGYADRIAYIGRMKVEWEANARLIAAAPELLAAISELVAEADDHPGWEGHPHKDSLGFGMARAALAKAEGSSS